MANELEMLQEKVRHNELKVRLIVSEAEALVQESGEIIERLQRFQDDHRSLPFVYRVVTRDT